MSDLVMGIYTLAASEMWTQQYESAKVHFAALGTVIARAGGFSCIDEYVADSAILGGK